MTYLRGLGAKETHTVRESFAMANAYSQTLGFIATLVGAGLGTTLAAAWLQHRFGAQLEQLRAVLDRGSRIHERQVEALLKICSKLETASFYLRRAASAGLLEGEDRGELRRRAGKELALAAAEFSEKKLLLSDTLIVKLGEFFGEALSTGLYLRFAADPRLANSSTGADSWSAAQERAHETLPAVLEAIRAEARVLIHGRARGSPS